MTQKSFLLLSKKSFYPQKLVALCCAKTAFDCFNRLKTREFRNMRDPYFPCKMINERYKIISFLFLQQSLTIIFVYFFILENAIPSKPFEEKWPSHPHPNIFYFIPD